MTRFGSTQAGPQNDQIPNHTFIRNWPDSAPTRQWPNIIRFLINPFIETIQNRLQASRDLKPSDLLLNPYWKLAGFGSGQAELQIQQIRN